MEERGEEEAREEEGADWACEDHARETERCEIGEGEGRRGRGRRRGRGEGEARYFELEGGQNWWGNVSLVGWESDDAGGRGLYRTNSRSPPTNISSSSSNHPLISSARKPLQVARSRFTALTFASLALVPTIAGSVPILPLPSSPSEIPVLPNRIDLTQLDLFPPLAVSRSR